MVGFSISLVVVGFLVGTYFGTHLGSELPVKDQNGDSRDFLQEEGADLGGPPSEPKPLGPQPMTLPKDKEGLGLYPLGSGEPHADTDSGQAFPSDGAEQPIKVQKEPPMPFTVQVGAFRVRTQALLLANRLKEQGFSPFLERYEAKDGLWYRVRVGRFEDRKKAQPFLKKVRDTYPKAYLARVEDGSAIEGLE